MASLLTAERGDQPLGSIVDFSLYLRILQISVDRFPFRSQRLSELLLGLLRRCRIVVKHERVDRPGQLALLLQQ